MSDCIYCVDTSALVDLHKNYPPEHFLGVWEKVGDLADCGRLITVDLVKEECKDEHLVGWFSSHQAAVLGPTLLFEQCLKTIMGDLVSRNKVLVDIESRQSEADPFVIACAMARNAESGGGYASGPCVLVQHEMSKANSPTRVHIPDVAEWYGVRCMTIVDIVRSENWVFPSA